MPSESEVRQEALRLVHSVESREGVRRFIYKGKCMSPVLLDEDLLLVKPAAAAELRLGDILVYKAEGQFWVHRFLYREARTSLIVSKPDNAWKIDKPFPETSLVGIVREARRNKRRLDFTKGPVKFSAKLIGAFSFLETAAHGAGGRLPLAPSVKKILALLLRSPKRALVRLFTLRRAGPEEKDAG